MPNTLEISKAKDYLLLFYSQLARNPDEIILVLFDLTPLLI